PSGGGYQEETQTSGRTPLARTIHYYHGDPTPSNYYLMETGQPHSPYPSWGDGKEFETDDVALETGQVAKKTINVWGQRACGAGETCWFVDSTYPTVAANNVSHDPLIGQTNTSLLDSGTANPLTSATAMLYDQYNSRTGLYEYNFGSAPD